METKRNPLILVSNDDGVQAKGLNALIDVVRSFGDVIVVAPEKGESGMSHAISMRQPVRINKIRQEQGLTVYSCSGTPADSIKIAINQIVPFLPDYIVSGINHGSNASISIIYSGTMGATMEGCFYGIPALGFSLLNHDHNADFTVAKKYSELIFSAIMRNKLPEGTCLNVNIPDVPASAVKGIKICRQTRGVWKEEYIKRVDPNGEEYFWLTGSFSNYEPDDEETDEWALKHNFVSVVPILIDFTSYPTLNELKKWKIE